MTDKMEFSDILEDMSIQHASLLNARGIEIEIDCGPALFWALDRNLIAGVLDNVINNCFRYTKEKVTISSFTENGYLVIRIEDDGTGYPPFMLFNEKNNPEFKKGIDFQTGSKGLGIYFAVMASAMHKNNGKSGFVSIDNGGKLNGGVFSVYIP
jgi:two-component system sensor histidine kinase SenX3